MLSLSSCQLELLYTSLLAAALLWVARTKHFFSLGPRLYKNSLHFSHVLGAFAVFAGSYTLIYALVNLLVPARTLQISGFMSLFGFGGAMLLLLLYLGKSSSAVKRDIIAPLNSKKVVYFYGMLTWTIAFPTSLFLGKITACIMEGLFNYHEAVQSVTRQLLLLRGYPLLFTFTALVVIIFVPIVEEILFRGFVQNYLKNKMPRTAALFLTTFLFTAAHFSLAQGLGNAEILTTLFVLSLFLSFIYEKWGNILAPIALHQTFNCISFITLFLLPPEGRM